MHPRLHAPCHAVLGAACRNPPRGGHQDGCRGDGCGRVQVAGDTDPRAPSSWLLAQSGAPTLERAIY
ncbi:TPA: hypothetical protein BOS_10087 [Bos taurus]|nr:TPA: hypothetical protein BOS_10087 [Bos taurus]